MFEFVIKIEKLNPVNHPLTIENFRQIINEKDKPITYQVITDAGYAPFIMESDAHDSLTQKAVYNGYASGDDGYVRKSFEMIEKTLEEKMEVFDEFKIASKKNIESFFNKEISVLKEDFPSEEVLTWTKQESEARAFIDDNNYVSPLLTTLASSRDLGETIQQLCEKIIEKADIYTDVVFNLIGKRKKLLTAIENALTLEELNSIVW